MLITAMNLPPTRVDLPPSTAEALNLGCFCRTLNPARLRAQIEGGTSLHRLTQHIAQDHGHGLLAATS